MNEIKYKKSQYWDNMVDILDDHFPKGKCKERGQAMVMLTYIELLISGHDIKKGQHPLVSIK